MTYEEASRDDRNLVRIHFPPLDPTDPLDGGESVWAVRAGELSFWLDNQPITPGLQWKDLVEARPTDVENMYEFVRKMAAGT